MHIVMQKYVGGDESITFPSFLINKTLHSDPQTVTTIFLQLTIY